MSDVRDTNHDGKVSLVEKVKDKMHGHKDTTVTTSAIPASGVVPAVAIVPAVVSTSYATGSTVDSRDLNRDGHVSLMEKLASTHIGTKESEEMHLKLHEEQLAISKREVGAGEVDIRKRVHEQHVSQTVPVIREEVIVERRPLSGIADPNARIAAQDETLHVAMFREEIVTEKRVVPIEEVIVRKKEVVDQQVVGATLRSEHIETVQTNALSSSSAILTGGVHDIRDTNLDGHVSMGEKIKGAALGTNTASTTGALDARDTNRDGHVSMGEKVKGAALAAAPKAARG